MFNFNTMGIHTVRRPAGTVAIIPTGHFVMHKYCGYQRAKENNVILYDSNYFNGEKLIKIIRH